MSESIIYKTLKLTDRFNVAFPDEHIPYGYTDKTKTRVGITYTAFHDKRHSITLIPPVAVIDEAVEDYQKLRLFPVYEGVRIQDVKEYLLSDAQYKRIVSTPEGFAKVICAARGLHKLDWLYRSFFLYLDEVHCYATDDFRGDILTPFDNDEVWEFAKYENLGFGSATAYKFSDPRFAQLPHYKITYKEKFGKVTIINDHNPKAVLNYMLTHPEMFPGKVFIWYNSVTQTGDVITTAGVTDVAIFCRYDEKNMVNLEDCAQYFQHHPGKDEYKKFNFFSRRYDEGWNLVDDETATIILMTDIYTPHSLIGIPFQGFQAVGRLNVTPDKIYHITNNYGKGAMRDFDTVQQKCIYNASKQITYYNQHRADCINNDMEDDGKLKALINPFAKFKNEVAELYHQKHDQLICAEYCKEHYSNEKTIAQTWQSLNYTTEHRRFDLVPVIRVKKSQEDINKQVIERFKELRDNPGQYVYETASASLKKYKTEFLLLFDALEILGEQEIERLGYNNEAMKAALINKSNQNAEAKLRLLLIDEFKLGNRYPKQYIKTRLQEFYNLLSFKKPDGTIKRATATQLKEFGLFTLHECKVEDEHGELRPGFKVVKLLYTVRQAA